MGDTEEWAQAFAAAAEGGDAGKTMQIVTALTIRAVEEDDVPSDIAEAVDLDALLVRLAAESSAVRRNYMVREWLATYRATVVRRWATLHLPMPSRVPECEAMALPVNEPEPEPQPVLTRSGGSGRSSCGGAPGGVARGRGLVVFDFDLTLAVKNVGIFDLEDCDNRSFGGAQRVAMLRAMLQNLSDSGVETVVLTFNSSHTVRKALGPRPGCGLLPLLRGNKTNAETIIGCEDYTKQERFNSKGRGDVFVKSAVINSRWLRPGRFHASQILFVVSQNNASVRSSYSTTIRPVIDNHGRDCAGSNRTMTGETLRMFQRLALGSPATT